MAICYQLNDWIVNKMAKIYYHRLRSRQTQKRTKKNSTKENICTLHYYVCSSWTLMKRKPSHTHTHTLICINVFFSAEIVQRTSQFVWFAQQFAFTIDFVVLGLSVSLGMLSIPLEICVIFFFHCGRFCWVFSFFLLFVVMIVDFLWEKMGSSKKDTQRKRDRDNPIFL